MHYQIVKINSNEYQGPDISLDISLREYGIAWKVSQYSTIENPEFMFLYGVGYKEMKRYSNEVLYQLFDTGFISQKDFIETFNESWFDKKSFLSFIGITEKEFLLSFPYGVRDMVQYYGYEEIFGSAYYPFKIQII